MNSKANEALIVQIKDLKAEHPYWGYRRIWAYLKFQKGLKINRKRIYRLMKELKLLVPKNKALRASRSSTTHKPKTMLPNDYWGIDMTKIMLPEYGWLYIHVVIDWGSKKLLSSYVSETSTSGDWIAALNEAVNLQYPNGIRNAKHIPHLVSDHGSQPTSSAFKKVCSELGIKQIFASYCNPKGNADTERVIRTMKEDLIWIREFKNIFDFKSALKTWTHSYNEEYPHSSIGYYTPCEYERWYNSAA